MLVKFERAANGGPLWVNPDHVIAVAPSIAYGAAYCCVQILNIGEIHFRVSAPAFASTLNLEKEQHHVRDL